MRALSHINNITHYVWPIYISNSSKKRKVRLVPHLNLQRQGSSLLKVMLIVCVLVVLNGRAHCKDQIIWPEFKPQPQTEMAKRLDVQNRGVLSQNDLLKYEKIFELQTVGKWNQADKIIRGLNNKILLGYVFFQRYMHPTAYRSSFSELSNWMKLYYDHPGAIRIYRLAKRRQPKGSKRPKKPFVRGFKGTGDDNPVEISKLDREVTVKKLGQSSKKRTRATRKRVRKFMAQIRGQIKREILTKSEQQVKKTSQVLLDYIEADQLLWEIAARWYYRGDNDEKAYSLAASAANRSRSEVEIADWTAGLAAWRMGHLKQAQVHFEELAKSSKASPWNVAAGAYWAARTNLVNKQPDKVKHWLKVGAQQKRTFYGLLSARLLGEDSKISSETIQPKEGLTSVLAKQPAILRAIALKEIGKEHLADKEVKQLIPSANDQQTEALLNLSIELDLPNTTIELALKRFKTASPYYDSVAYPTPSWIFPNGSLIDRALIFAFIRQESRFNTRARSRAGARGLMQLMPRTASFVAHDRSLHTNKRYRLYEPELNLELGQKYLKILMNNESIGSNLFLLAAAYNAGPKNMKKWLRQTPHANDPLLFIESIPAKETRLFVERVLTNLWVYRLKLGQEMPSLDSVVEGRWPNYYTLDQKNDASINDSPRNPQTLERKTALAN